jgi:hypothetical protein
MALGPTIPTAFCGGFNVSYVAAPGERLNLMPLESEQVREDYVLPTFNGGVRMLTESVRYSWFATAGSWSREQTGGPKDLTGEQRLDSTWTAPREPGQQSLWLVQRDERGGLTWYEYCVEVR